MLKFKIIIPVFLLLSLVTKTGFSQTCPAPSINAQAGTGPTANICSGLCANLTATVVPVNSTTSYSVGSVPYAPFPYAGGTSPVGAVDDVWSGVLNIGFPFCFYGNNFTQLLVGTNGEITFATVNANTAESFAVNAILPNLTEHKANTICGPYRDIDPSIGGNVRTYTTGVAPCRKFVAYWLNVPLYSCNATLSTFQIVLHESSNIIEVNMQNSQGTCAWQNGRGLVGIQNANATLFSAPPTRNTLTAWTATNESWRFTPTGAPTFTVNWSGPSGFTATGLTASPCPTATSNYTATMSLQNCTGGPLTTFTSAVQVSVTPTPTLITSASPATICPGNSSTLTASGATNYTWQPGSIFTSTAVVSPASTTIYTVTGQNGLCSSTQTTQVNLTTTVSATTNSPSICSGNSTTLTGSGATTYTWNPGNLSGPVVVVSPTTTTTYTLSGTNGVCTSSTTLLITVNSTPTVTASSSGTICSGASATLTGSGATSYTWNPGALTGAIVVVNPLITTVYTVIGANGTCTNSANVTVTVTPGPIINTLASPTSICPGNSSNLLANGAVNYTWQPGGQNTPLITVSPLATTVYTVTGDNGIGCSSTATLTLTVLPTPTITINPSATSICLGNSATLTASGATSYTWNPGNLTTAVVVVSPITSTNYTIVGSNGTCTSSVNSLVTVVPVPTVSAISSSTAICSGATVTLTASGATTYTWNPGGLVGSTVTDLPLTTTTYTVIGDNGSCTASTTLTVVVNTTPTITANASPTAICVSGNVTLTASGAATYTWNPGGLVGSPVIAFINTTTNYTVIGSSAAGCTNTAITSVTVDAIPVLVVSASPTAICIGNSSTLTVTGATAYTWNPGALTGSNVVVTPIVNTTYTVLAVNGACSASQTITINVNPTPTLTATASPTTICAGSSSTLTASGAITYTWNPGALIGTNVTVTPLVTTLYTVTGSSAAGCTSTQTVNLIVTPVPTVNAVANPTAICVGNSSTLTASGATTYTWNPGALIGANVTVSPLINTTYTVTGATGNCTSTQTVTVIVNPLPSLTLSASPATICATNSSTLTATGAVNYTWNPGALTGSNVVVSPTVTTTYTVIGASAFGCTSTSTINLIVNPSPTITVASSNTNICAGSSATLTANGGVTYFWNPLGVPGSVVVVTPSVTTTYTVIGTNALGCSNTQTFTQIVTPNPTVTTIASPTAVCLGNSSTLTASGATSYTWNPGALIGANVTVSPLVNTTYTVTGATGNCSSTQTVTVIVNPLPTLTLTASPVTICVTNSSTLTALGAANYTWNPGALSGSNVVVSPTVTTTYTVIGASAFGCTSTSTINVVVNPTPTITVASSNTNICAGSSATLTASGGVTYFWNPLGVPGSVVVVTPSVTTTYTVIGTNALGCINTQTFTQFVTPNPTVTALATPTAVCLGNASTLTASGATNYTWNPGALTGSNVVVTPLVNTTYTLTGANGACTTTQTLSVVVNPVPTLTLTASPTTICVTNSSTLTALGAINYTWNPGALSGSNVVVSPTVTTTYTVIGDNAFGCVSTGTIDVFVNPTPTLTIASSNTNICSGSSATLTASGGVTYFWNPLGVPGSVVVVTPSVTTTYTVIGTNALGCINTQTFTQFVTPNPTVTALATPTAVCLGNSSTLTASGATTYTWNPGALTGSNVVVTPLVNTTYTLTGANGACTTTQTLNVNVNTTPTVTISSSASVICSGTQLTLTANGANSYTWLPPIAAISQTIIDNPLTNTSYTVVGSSASGCTNQAVFTVTVNTTPTVTAVSSPTSLCIGNTATLTANGATTFTWLPSGATTSVITDNPLLTTTYTLIGANGSCTNSTAITLVVNPNPTVTASANPTIICSGSSVSLTASGATSYSWSPISLTGANVTDVPTTNTTYTVTGTDNNGCFALALVSVSVNPSPTVTVISTPTSICSGNSATLSASGALTYTWNPNSVIGGTITVTPSVTTTYTVIGQDAIGCSNTQTLQLLVLPIPTVTAVSSPTSLCLGGTATLTANGALTYTWEPGTITNSIAIVNPTITTTYTVTGANGICGSATATITINVNTPPTVSASVSGSITCTTPSVNLLGAATPTNVNYSWNGPSSYTSSVQSPSGIAIPGVYTLSVIDIVTGCSASATTAILTDSNVPTVSITVSGNITCANNSVTLTALTSATNAGFNWTGPAAYTNTNSAITVSIGGNYSLTITDLTANCPASTIVTVFTNTTVPITATLFPATCSGSVANNDASIIVSGFVLGDKYDFVPGLTYTGTANYVTATNIPLSGGLTNTLFNPTVITPYTVRFFGANGCIKDTTLFLIPTSCLTNSVFGIAKAVSAATLQTNGSYNVTYKIVVKNNGSVPLTNVVLNENLLSTFPLPTTFSIISTPTIITASSSLTLDATFDGTLQTTLTNTLSVLNANATDTILFSLNIIPNGFFGPFNNTVLGFSQIGIGSLLSDSSNVGINPDPDNDGLPGNNNIPTPLNLAPKLFFGITKVGSASEKLPDNTYDLSYTITVHNLGNDTLKNVVLKDSLFKNTIKYTATYTIKAGPIATGSLVANANYNGNTDINLTVPSQSKLPPGFVNSITFTINVKTDTVTVFKNSAYGSALSSNSVAVSDTSNNGINPDSNGNGIWNEASDNVPTVLSIHNYTLFVPQGFSPDADTKNDFWVIKGLPTGVDNTVTVYNRWGNKVYQKKNYDNTWGGFPNVSGTLGNEKLPQGTYYYIIEFSSSEFKPLNGFVILQY